MKNRLIYVALLAIVGLSGFVSGKQQVNKTYSDLMIVTEIDRESGLVTLENSSGVQYSYYDDMEDDIDVNDYLDVTMFDTGKQNYIYDDEIVNVRYERIDLF